MTDKLNSPQFHGNGDDESFEQYLQGDSQLSRLYKHSACPSPSKQLDLTILAAAQRQAENHHWWRKPGSWAATIAIVSLVAIVAHNTWKTEQEYLPQELEQQTFRDSLPEAESDQPSSATEQFRPERKQLSSQAVPSRQRDIVKDARKPVYKSAPAPVLVIPSELRLTEQADSLSREEAGAPGLSTTKARQSLQGAALTETITSDSVTKKEKKSLASDLNAQQWLERIRQLLSDNQTEEAQQLFLQFRKKYPDYPVDPVILQQLSPY